MRKTDYFRGLKDSAKIYDEMILDVNTDYFEQHGGYDFAKRFYREAYRFAAELYGERHILSAVMHADEINLALSDKYDRPIYHYHLHIVALPVVEKQVLWSKRCKNKALVGTVKETIQQVSHSKKWKSQQVLDDQGKPRLIPSYSVLQDEFFKYMQEAGFTDFVRGERGSTAANLSCVEYQTQQEQKRLAELQERIREEQQTYESVHTEFKTYTEIEEMGKKTLTGKITVSQKDYEALTDLAKEGIASRGQVNRLKEENQRLSARVWRLQTRLDELTEKCRPYLEAVKAMPEKVMAFLNDILEKVRLAEEERRNKLFYQPKRKQEPPQWNAAARGKPKKKEDRER